VEDAGGEERAREKEKWFRKAHDMVIAMFKARLGRRRRAGDKGWVLEGLPHCESLARGLWELGEDCRPHLVIALEPGAYVSIRQHTPADAHAGAAEKRGDKGKEEVERAKQQGLGAAAAGGAGGERGAAAAGAHEALTHASEQAQTDSTAARALATDKRSRAAGQHAHATRALREGGGGEEEDAGGRQEEGGVGGVGGGAGGHAAGDTSAAAAKASQAREERQGDVGGGQAAEGVAAGERERGGQAAEGRAAGERERGGRRTQERFESGGEKAERIGKYYRRMLAYADVC
jgi:hypothetical protein